MGRARHAAAHGPAESAAGVCKGMLLHFLPQPLGERHRGIEHSPGKNQQELFAAVAADAVYLARLAFEQLRELLEH